MEIPEFCETYGINYLKNRVTYKKNDKGEMKKKIIYPEGYYDGDEAFFDKHNDTYKYKHNCYCLILKDVTNILVFDTDDEESDEMIRNILSDNDLIDEDCITPSFSNIHLGKSSNHHYYFQVEKQHVDKINSFNTGDKIGVGGKDSKLDWFYNRKCNVIEDAETTIDEPLFISYGVVRIIFETFTERYSPKIAIMPNQSSSESNTSDDSDDEPEPEKSKKVVKPTVKKDEIDARIYNSDEEHIMKLLQAIPLENLDNFEVWFAIGMALRNEGFNMELYHDVCKSCSKYDHEGNRRILNGKSNRQGYTIATLYYYVKKFNPAQYEVLAKERRDFIKLMLNFTSYDICKYYFNINPDKYVYSPFEEMWISYNSNNIVVKSKKLPIGMTTDIVETLRAEIDEQHKHISPKRDDYQAVTKLLKKNYEQLGRRRMITDSCDELTNFYATEDEIKYDNNNNIICFKNGICYDYSICDFRRIERQDFVTITTGYEIKTKSDPKARKFIVDFLLSIFNTNEMVEYFMSIVGKSIFTTKEQKFYILTGTGGNGKSLLCDFIGDTLGKYFYSASNNFFGTQNNDPSAANSALANCEGKRLVVAQEPKAKIDNAYLKSLVGQKKVTTRALFQNEKEYKGQFNCMICCNEIPQLTEAADKAIERRVKVIEFRSRFVENPDPSNPLEKKINEDMKETLEEQRYINEMMLLLFDYAKKYKTEKAVEPPEVALSSKSFIQNNNHVLNFMQSTYEKSEGDNILMSAAYEEYINDDENEKMTLLTFSKNLKKHLFVTKKTNVGIKIMNLKLKEKKPAEEDE